MQVRWTYELPELGEDAPDSSNAPLHWDGEAVLVPISSFEHDRETRGADPSARGSRIHIHRVGGDGRGTVESFLASETLISASWSFLRLGDRLVLHVGTFHTMPGGEPIAGMPFVAASDGAGRGVFLQHQGALIFADERKGSVHCHDLESAACRWTLELPGSGYSTGPVAIHGAQLVWYARDALNTIDLATGSVQSRQTFRGIDKFYPPVEHEGDLLFAYTNHTIGGLIRFDPRQNRVKWTFKKRGRVAAPRGGPLPVVGRTAVLSVNDGSSLVGVDVDSGEARWSFRAQWLYTPIEVDGHSLIFGTSGGHGRHLRRHHAETGETEWAVQMDGGCPYYSSQGDHLVAGDWSGVLRRVRRADGDVVDELDLGAPITTAPLVVGTDLFVLRWPTDRTRPALVAVAS